MSQDEIDWNALRRGDLARMVRTTEGRVTAVDMTNELVFLDGIGYDTSGTWELLDRPTPEPKLGSVWVDPDFSVSWVYRGDGLYEHVNRAEAGRHDELIARLVPAEGDA